MDGMITPSKSEVMPPGTPALKTPEPLLPEPPMVFPRPSSDRAQDVSHILASLFKDLYTREVMSKDMVQNLTTTSDGSSEFHKKCMQQLKDVQNQHKMKMQKCTELEKHIIHARARAVSSDERALNNAAGDITVKDYEQLGLPNVKSNLKGCLSDELMKTNNLISLSDIFPSTDIHTESPRKHKTPHYFLPTLSSSMHLMKGPLDDGYTSLDEIAAANAIETRDDETHTTLSSDSFELRSNKPKTKIKASPPPKQSKHKWRENMNQENRVDDRALLARLEQRHNFLKNPRFCATKKDDTSFSLQDNMFSSKPSVVRFTSWSVGRVYETVLELKNTLNISAQLRIVPPATQFFSITLGKYPGEGSIVASGMSVKYNIRFMPDSLSDFEDEISVVGLSGPPLIVPLIGKRDPPILNLPTTISNGHCLVGGTKVKEMIIKNSGGSGRFCVLKKSSWPAVNFKTAVISTVLEIGQFLIRPAVFELLAGQVAILEVLFTPLECKKYVEDILIVCDNCQVKEFTIDGEGQLAAVEIVSVSDGGESEPILGECTDMTADHLIRFPPLNPHSFYMKQVIVHNSCNVDMPYEWHCLKPNLTSSILKFDKPIEGRFEFYPDESLSFFIEPRKGVLQANGIHEFALSFAPGKVGDYHNVLHMVLSNIPEIKQEENESSQGPHKNVLSRQESIPKAVKSQSGSFSPSDRGTPKASKPSMASSSNKSIGPQLREVIALEIETKGESVPYSVLFHPPAIVIPGEILKGTTSKRPFRMANYSLAPVEFKWSSEMTNNIIEVEPSIGVLQPGDYHEMEVSVTGSSSGKIDAKLECVVEHLDSPLSMQITAQIKGPEVVSETFSLDFGLLRCGTIETRKVTIRNTTQLHAIWRLTEKVQKKSNCRILLSPSSGELLPLGRQDITVTLQAFEEQSLNNVLDLTVEDGNTFFIAVKAEIQTPEVCFLASDIVIKDCYLSVPQIHTSTMINQTLFPTKFNFIGTRGKQASVCDITTHPSEGIIGPQERLDIQVTVSCHVPGEIKDVFILCQIEGMKYPIVLALYSNVQTLSVTCETDAIEFGNSVKLGVFETKEVVITNNTSIRAPWSVYMEKFAGYMPTQPPVQTDFKTPRTRRTMLGRTPNLADPLSKTPTQVAEDNAKLMLKGENGIAFCVKSKKGFLEPYQKLTIPVTVYSNMWGNYNDTLVCKISSLPDIKIPIHAKVVGCPLIFQVVAGGKDKQAVVRFGSHITNGPAIYRKMRILNRSPCDIQIDWKSYDTSNMQNAQKIIDLNIWFGKAFPKRDSNGNEVVRQIKSSSTLISSEETMLKLKRSNSCPKMVSVKIFPHLGEESLEPFQITPCQSNVPAHGQVTVEAVFHPGNAVDHLAMVTGFANGYMTLLKAKDLLNGNAMQREDGYNVEPIKLEMTASLHSANLNFQPDSDDECPEDCDVEFKSSLGYLLDDNCLANEHVQYQNFTLKNISEMALEFTAVVSSPFFMTNASKSKINSAYRINKSTRNRVTPQDNIRVKLGFVISSQTLTVLDDIRMDKLVPGARVVSSSDGKEQLIFEDIVEINFLNKSKQNIRVRAIVFLPKLELSTKSIDFETCFVNQEENYEVKLFNLGEAKSAWSCELHYGEQSVDSGVFRIEPDSGVLEGMISNISTNNVLIKVFYTPHTNKECNAIILFKGQLGEITRSISVTGCGSYDGIFSTNQY